MSKRLLAMLLAVVMVFGMIPVLASAAATAGTPQITKVSMSLGGILEVNFKAASNGADMSGYSVRVTTASGSQEISTPTRDGDLYVYTAKVPAHRLLEAMTVELLNGSTVVHKKENWTVASYLAEVAKADASLAGLVSDLQNYAAYAAYYADPTGTAPSVPEVSAVTQAQMETYKLKLNEADSALGATAALYIDDACDIRIKFNASAWNDYKLLVDGTEQPVVASGDKVICEITELLPQNWSKMYHIQVVDANEAAVMDFEYSVLSYVYIALGKTAEAAPGLNGLLQSMFLYNAEAAATQIPEDTKLVLPNIWVRDPFILNDGDAYYLYGTTHATAGKFQVYSSTDLVNWVDEGYCFDVSAQTNDLYYTPADNAGDSVEVSFWAPEVYAYNDAYYMFATFTPKADDPHYQATAILKSESPTGPFELWSDGFLTPAGHSALDGTLYIEDSVPYMIYCHEWECSCLNGTGTMEYIQLSDDLRSTVGEAHQLFTANQFSWRENWSTKYSTVTDGCYVYSEGGVNYLLWSTYVNGNYITAYTTFTTLAGGVSKTHTKLYESNGGHAMIFTDMNGVDRLVLHNDDSKRASLFNVTVSGSVLALDGVDVWDGFGYDAAQEFNEKDISTGSTVFIGDSFFDSAFWTTFNTDLNGKDALLYGIGGTTASDWIKYMEYNALLDGSSNAPKNIVINIGNNDVFNDGMTQDKAVSDIQQMLTMLKQNYPSTNLYLFSITPRQDANLTVMNAVNSAMQSWCGENGVTYLNIHDQLGTDKLSDGIHPEVQYYESIFLAALYGAGCEIVEPIYQEIGSLTELNHTGGYYKLSGNITGNTTTVIGFTGKLDGNGYTVETSVPLFDSINSANILVENLNVVLTQDLSATGILSAGIINQGKISNVHISAANNAKLLGGDNEVGGFATSGGYATFVDCSNAVQIVGNNYAGGILGTTQGVSFTGCSNSGAVSGSEAGGIVGRNTWDTSTFTGCTNTGSITVASTSGSDNPGAGGMIGRTVFGTANLTNCVNEGTVTAEGHYAGGMVGFHGNDATVNMDGCINRGAVNAGQMAGGMLGWALNATNTTIRNSDNYGTVTAPLSGASNMEAGGIVARIQGNSATIENCDNYGKLTGWRSGGIGAYSHGATVAVSGCINYGESKGINADVWDAASAGIWARGNDGTLNITSCVNNGTVHGSMSGGIVGMSWANNTNLNGCINNGSVISWAQDAAGVMGRVQGGGTSSITDCTNNGVVIGMQKVAQLNTYTHDDAALNWAGSNGENGKAISRSKIVRVSQMSDISSSYDAWGTYVLDADITWDTTRDFHSQLIGNGHTIRTAVRLFTETSDDKTYIENVNIVLTQSLRDTSVLFDWLMNCISIKNVRISAENGATLTGLSDGNTDVGVFARKAENVRIINCTNSVNVSGTGNAGGFVGIVGGSGMTITGCENSGNITSAASAGGFIGRYDWTSNVTISDCTNYGSITAAKEGAGGIVGMAHQLGGTNSISRCINQGVVTNTNTSEGFAGGIAGYFLSSSNITIFDCTNKAEIVGANTSEFNCAAAGILARTTGCSSITVKNCVNDGVITASMASGVVGMVWASTVDIIGNTNNGNVTAYGQDASGIVNRIQEGSTVLIQDDTNNAVITGGQNVGQYNSYCHGSTLNWAGANYENGSVVKS